MTCPRSPSQAMAGAVLESISLTIGPFSWLPRGLSKMQSLAKDVAHDPDLGFWAFDLVTD